MKIAIVGLGKMGLNMATRLTRQGIAVVGFDIAPLQLNGYLLVTLSWPSLLKI